MRVNVGYLVVLLSSLSLLALADSVTDNGLNTSEIEVIDDFGRVVRLAAPARRIIALSPHIVENLYSAGLGDYIVATVSYADYPASAKVIPRIGGFANFSVESILSFQPDLVIGWGSGYTGLLQLVDQLTALGITVYIDEPGKLEDIPHSIKQFGVLGGTQESAQRRIEAFTDKLLVFRESAAGRLSQQPVRVFYPVWPEPLQTLGGGHIVSDVIRLCGGDNIFHDVPVLAPTVNTESVLALNPQVIIASASSGDRPGWLDDFGRWEGISAVKNQQLYYIDGDLLSRHTERMLEGVGLMCSYIDNARRQGDE